MAEVENVTAATAADIPNVPSSDVGAAELGTSPAQERSSNSHPHDSEYDTASDLEGGDDYDDDDDDGESISDDEEDEEDDDEDVDEADRARGLDGGPEKSDDLQKKVDEDRSNPQYIPKRGTFYEHDDRTAEGGEGLATQTDDLAEDHEVGGANPQSPTAISHASKTMKKWQPASGVDRWSHDRFDANEQAPKSRSELVNAYGYDIRNEDAPPRARRRRRYGRGPSKYSRNWEDETAYLKASNTPRKPPKPSDFPALNERTKPRKPNSVKEEKENHLERRLLVPMGEKPNNNTVGASPLSHSDERQERDTQRKGNRNRNFGRNQQAVGRQAAMEFKNKRANQSQVGANNHQHNSQNYRLENQQHHERNMNRSHHSDANEQIRNANKSQMQAKHAQHQQNDHYNANNELSYAQMQPQQNNQPTQNQRQHPSNLSARLHQVQNRNDPSHVGSVQMHALANQNQISTGQQQQTGMLLAQQQQQQLAVSTAINQQDQGRPKRYSSIRRSQHDTQNIDQQHQLQQIHMQQQQIGPQPLMLQDQHLLQANLMQLYHQENLQAQMQALQVSGPQTGPQKPPTYTAVASPQQPPQPYAAAPSTGAAPTAYYVTAAEAFTGNAPNAQAPPAAQYAPQPPPNYLQNPTTSAAVPQLTYTSPPPPPQQTVVSNTSVPVPTAGPLAYGGPNTVASGPTQTAPSAAAPTAGQPGYQNYPNYQNYNTVGGTTYFVPPPQAPSRPAVLPQRRPTNAIPILPPSEKNKQRNQLESKDETVAKITAAPLVGSVENIDHIIDNMFVQRPAFQPQPATPLARKGASPQSESTAVVPGEENVTPSSAQSSSNATQNEEQSPEQPSNNDSTTETANVGSAKETI